MYSEKFALPKNFSSLTDQEYEMDGGKVDWKVVAPIIMMAAGTCMLAGGIIGAKVWARNNAVPFVDANGVTTMIAPETVPTKFTLLGGAGFWTAVGGAAWGVHTLVERNK